MGDSSSKGDPTKEDHRPMVMLKRRILKRRRRKNFG
jgi:hypothetical protein